MTISATNQGLRPGVCTSTSRPSSPFDGQVIYETDTDRIAVWNGTAWTYMTGASFTEWTTYTPSNTNVTVGNGTQTARYAKVGKTVMVSYKLVWGSTTSYGGTVEIGIPSTSNSFSMATCMMTDAGSSNIVATVVIDPSTSKAVPRPATISGSYPRFDNATNATTPYTWTTNDVLQFFISYEEQ